MARVTHVNKARKAQGSCGKCGDPIKKGNPYRHASPGFRAAKKVRCMKPQCAFRSSDLTTSNMATAYAAVEAAEDDIANMSDPSELDDIMSTLAEGLRECAEMYSEANDAWGQTNGAENYEWTERRDALEGAADEAESHNIDTSMPDEVDEPDEDSEQEQDEALERISEEAMEFVGNLSFE